MAECQMTECQKAECQMAECQKAECQMAECQKAGCQLAECQFTVYPVYAVCGRLHQRAGRRDSNLVIEKSSLKKLVLFKKTTTKNGYCGG